MPSWLIPMLAAAWLVTGIAVPLVLGRRGHDSVTWLLVAAMLGPLSIIVALDAIRHDEHLEVEAISRPPAAPTSAAGLRVLAGYDGSPDAQATVTTVIDLLGPRLAKLTLARVLPFDEGREADVAARAVLEAEAGRHPGAPIELEIIHGPPAAALEEAALAGQYDLLAVGASGAARSHVLGSTVRPLLHRGGVPVVVCSSRAD